MATFFKTCYLFIKPLLTYIYVCLFIRYTTAYFFASPCWEKPPVIINSWDRAQPGAGRFGIPDNKLLANTSDVFHSLF